jgi:hypothetical protein
VHATVEETRHTRMVGIGQHRESREAGVGFRVCAGRIFAKSGVRQELSHSVSQLAGSDDVDACAVSSREDLVLVGARDCSCARPHEFALAVGDPAGTGWNLGGVLESADGEGESDESCSVRVGAQDLGGRGQPFESKKPHRICAGELKARWVIANLHRACIAPQERDVRSPPWASRQERGSVRGRPKR